MLHYLYDSFANRWLARGGSVWFYSDPHFNDPEMPAIRKNYISDDEQVKRINSKIGKNDTLIILGDIGDTKFIQYLRGYKVLIMGNHDGGATNYQRRTTIDTAWNGNKEIEFRTDNRLFDEVYEGALMISSKIILSHEPIMSLPAWLFNIHGHDHSNPNLGPHHLNVCAEHINYTPISLTSIIKEGRLHNIEDIHRITIDNAIIRKGQK